MKEVEKRNGRKKGLKERKESRMEEGRERRNGRKGEKLVKKKD